MYVCVCVCVCVCVKYVYTYIDTYKYAHTYTHTHNVKLRVNPIRVNPSGSGSGSGRVTLTPWVNPETAYLLVGREERMRPERYNINNSKPTICTHTYNAKRSTGHTHTQTKNNTSDTDTHKRQEQHPKPPNEHLPQTLNNARCVYIRTCSSGGRSACGLNEIS